MNPDRCLLDAWRAGDSTAGQKLFRRHLPAVVRFFQSRVADHAAEDLVQRTFLACMEGRNRYAARGSVRGYLFGIARRQLLLHFRETARANFDPGVTSLAEIQPSPSTVMAEHEEREALLGALRELPIDAQILLELHYWEGFSMEELSEVLQTPAGTIKTRLFRARRQLRALMGTTMAVQSHGDDFDDWLRSVRRQARNA